MTAGLNLAKRVEKMEANECCLWQAEIVDDTLKSFFQADGAVQAGSRGIALAYLERQPRRINAILEKVKQVCGSTEDKEELAERLNKDIQSLKSVVLRENPLPVHDKIMELDKKYALSNYVAFARCSVNVGGNR